MERGQGEEGEVPCRDGAGSSCIEDSAGKQRILKRRGPGRGRSSRERQGKHTQRQSTPSMPSRKSPYIPDIRVEEQEGRGERRDGDRWKDGKMDTGAGRDCAGHVEV